MSSDSVFVYDPMYRLVKATGREHAGQVVASTGDVFEQYPFLALVSQNATLAFRTYDETYQYDKVGNILNLNHAGGSSGTFNRAYNYAAGNNHLTQTGAGTDYTYDPHGNCTKMPSLPIMNWDYFDRLCSTAKQLNPNGMPETTFYQYDGQGNRVRKIKVQAVDGFFIGAPALTLLSETRYLGEFEEYWKKTGIQPLEIFSKTVHVSDETGRFALIEDDGTNVLTRYQHTNHLGSSHLETNGSGEVISYEEYHPFGTTAYQATLNSLGPSAKRYRFCGKEKDEESGLYYYGARYYASWLGRFISVDPKESKYFFQSSFAYAENSPVVKMDWNGEGTDEEVKRTGEWIDKKGNTFSGTYTNSQAKSLGYGALLDTVTVTAKKPGLTLGFQPNSSEISELENERVAEIERYFRTPSTITMKDPSSLPSSTLQNPSASSDYIQFQGAIPKIPERQLATGKVDFDAGTMFLIGGLATSSLKAGSYLYEGFQANRIYGGKELFHYTSSQSGSSILQNGLTVTEMRREIFLTTKGNLTPIQAQLDLALSTQKSLPNSLISVQSRSLLREGILPSRGPKIVQGNLPGTSGGGGGIEVIFNQTIPKYLLKRKY